tara:strand:- start:1376 stop:1918 length:543 start_codon:yes stop_codon:yes gene_type:complete
MHTKIPNIYYFINKFDKNHLNKLSKNIGLIYRNYNKKIDENLILEIKKYCKKNQKKFFLANNIKLAFKLNLDGAYIPGFNYDFRHLNYPRRKEFIILGSAHNYAEIRIKELQNVDIIFLSSIFKKKESFLGIYNFLKLKKITNKKIICLGGVSLKNIKKIRLLNIYGYSGISFFEKKRPL